MKVKFLVFAIGGSLPLASLTLSGQFLILDDENNKWRESHVSQANDPSAN